MVHAIDDVLTIVIWAVSFGVGVSVIWAVRWYFTASSPGYESSSDTQPLKLEFLEESLRKWDIVERVVLYAIGVTMVAAIVRLLLTNSLDPFLGSLFLVAGSVIWWFFILIMRVRLRSRITKAKSPEPPQGGLIA